jgi:hypothetical protein
LLLGLEESCSSYKMTPASSGIGHAKAAQEPPGSGPDFAKEYSFPEAALQRPTEGGTKEKWAVQEAAATHFTLDMLAAAVAGGITQTAVAPIER